MILDLIIILLFIIVAVVGYKIGFLATLVKLTSTLSGIIIAICFTKPITNVAVSWGLDNAIEERVYENITTSEAFLAYTEAGAGVEGLSTLLQELGIPAFMSGVVAGGIVNSVDPLEIARGISSGISYVLLFIIVFVGLLIFSPFCFFLRLLNARISLHLLGDFSVV